MRTAELEIKADLKNVGGNMNLKDLFDKAEGGVLTYEQFVSAATEAKAKFVDLSEGKYVDRQKYTDDLSARDTRITDLDNTVKARETDIEQLRTQLTEAGTDAEKLAELGGKFDNLQKQYDKDTKAYQKQLREQEYGFAVAELANKQKFTSQAAKRDFIQSLKAKNLTVENGTIIGATDFITAYSQDNADAFAKEDVKPAENKPHFVDPTSPTTSGEGSANSFNFGFAGVRPHATK